MFKRNKNILDQHLDLLILKQNINFVPITRNNDA